MARRLAFGRHSEAMYRGLLLSGLLLSAEAISLAQTAPGQLPPGIEQGRLHDPGSPNYQSFTPDSYPRQPATPVPYPSGQTGWNGVVVPFGYGVIVPGYGYGAWYPGGLSAGYSTGYTATPWGYSSYYAPQWGGVATGTEVFGGLGPVIQEPWQGGWQAAPPQVPVQPQIRERPRRQRPPEGDLEAARKFLRYGDQHFAKQRYLEALQRYRSAVRQGDLAEAHVRLGQTYIALGRYSEAAEAFRQALTRWPQWPAQPERLDLLYGENQAARIAHLDALAKAANERPQDADLVFLVAIQLYFNGQPERSRAFFQEVARRQVNHAHADAFLRELDRRAEGAAP